MPIGDSTSYHPVTITFDAVSPGGSITAFFNTAIAGSETFISPPIYDNDQLINNISSKGFWELDKGDAMLENGFSYSLTAQISDVIADDPDHNIGAPNELRLLRRDDELSAWEIAGDFSVASYDDINDVVSITINNIIDVFGDFALGGDSLNNPLPVCLGDFWLECAIDHIKIAWETLSETNSWYFTVEKSYDLSNWSDIGTVPANGNSSQNISYQVLDYGVNNKTAYYRLKQTDLDASIKIYDPESILCSDYDSGLYIHSIIADKGILKVLFSSDTQNVKYHLYTINGNLLLSGKINDLEINSLEKLQENVPQNGLYIIYLSNANGAVVRKFISL